MSEENRGAAMAASLVRTARTFGVDRASIVLVSRANALAMRPRVEAFDDDHHPWFLHPGRTVLILLRDAGVVDATVLAAAAVTDTEPSGLGLAPAEVHRALGGAVAELASAVPRPGSEGLVEVVLTSGPEVALVALAERLDHLRHAHLVGGELARLEQALDEARSVWLPLAERTHPVLARRYRHWVKTTTRRVERR